MTRTRFAPSPTGFMHIGNLRSALFSYLIAKHENGHFILRLEDTDHTRKEPKAEEFIYDMLESFHIPYDEGPKKPGEYGPYKQSERLNIYKTYAEKLIKKGLAYYCFCDKKTLNEKRIQGMSEDDPCRILSLGEAKNRVLAGESYVIRQKVPREGQTSFYDMVYGGVTVENKDIEDQILIKSDGYPTYNFANVIDDALMQITHVTRGNEYLSSTPKYLLLYNALNFPVPEFVHQPLVIKKNDSKLSKRNKDDNLLDLLKQGFLPEAIINYLALLGWSPKTNQEFFTLEELIHEFNIKNISKNPSCYDINKLKWFNKHYIMKMDNVTYLEFIRPYLENFYNLQNKTEEWITKLLLTYKNYISFGSEITLLTNVYFRENIELDERCLNFLKTDQSIPHTLKISKEELESIEDWTTESIKVAINNIKEKSNQSGNLLYMPIRIITSGTMHGPSLETTLYLLGKETVLKRLTVNNNN